MLRRTLPSRRADFSMSMDPVFPSPRKRYSSDFMYKGEGKTNSGFKQPYRIWAWRQRELFRNVQEAQFEHMRRVYRRQWYEAYRNNAHEYISKYNVTKAAQLVQWESEMEAQEQKRREAYQASAARQALRSKHLDLLREYNEKQFFAWYERASERLQYMAQTMKFVVKDDLEAHIEKELDKYVFEPNRSYPLNFAGQMPLLEDRDGQVVAAASHAFTRQNQYQLPGLQKYEPPSMSAQEADALAQSISGDLRSIDGDGTSTSTSTTSDVLNDELAAQVVDQMVAEQQRERDDQAGGEQPEDKMSNLDDETYQLNRRIYIDRARGAMSKRAMVRKSPKHAENLETIQDTDTTVGEAERKARSAVAEERAGVNKTQKRRDKKELDRMQREEALRKIRGSAAIKEGGFGGTTTATSAEGLSTNELDEIREAVRKAREEVGVEGAGGDGAAAAKSTTPATAGRLQKLPKPKLSEELLQKIGSVIDSSTRVKPKK